MAKRINFTIDNKVYKLEFSRATIREMASEGFDIKGFGEEDFTLLVPLFAGSFKMHHSGTSMKKIDEIYGMFKDKGKLAESLLAMYTEAYESLVAEPEEDSEKNIEWTMSE